MKKVSLALFAAFLLLAGAPALAQTGQLDTMLDTVSRASEGWLPGVLGEAQTLYAALIVVELLLTVFVWAYLHLSGKLSAGSVLATAVQKFIVLGLFLLFLQSYTLFLPRILATFQVVGARVSGIAALSPSAFLDQGVYLASRVLFISDNAGLLEIPVTIASLFCALALLVCFVLLAWRQTSLLIEGHILLTGGVLFIGFGGNRLTIQLAENFIVSLFRLGIHVYLIFLMLAVGNQLVPFWNDQINYYSVAVDGFAPLFRICGEVLIFTLIALRLPSRLAYELTAPSGFLHLRQALLPNY